MRFPFLAAVASFWASAALAQTAATPPPCASPEFRQLDFWVGDWELEFTAANGSIGRAENRITRDEFGDCVIVERFRLRGAAPDGGDYIGSSYSTFDPQTRSWRQMWIDNGGAMYDLRGGPVTGQRHIFELVNIEPRGQSGATMRMIWEDVSANGLVWRWQSQVNGGPWTDQWVLRYRRRP